MSDAGDDAAASSHAPDAAGTGTDDEEEGVQRPLPRSPRWDPTTKRAATVAVAVAALAGLYLARHALGLVALSGLLAFLVAPLIRVLQRRARFPKALALLTSYVVVAVGFVLVTGLIVSGIVSSFSEIDPGEVAESLRADAIDVLSSLRSIEVGSYQLDLSRSVDPLIDDLGSPGTGDDSDEEMSTFVVGGQEIGTLLGGVVASAQTVGGLVTGAVVTFLIALYLSADSHRFHAGLLTHVPPAYLGDAVRMSERFGDVWRGYLYGQLVNSLATGLLVWLVLWAVGLPGAFVLGLIMMLLNMIPTFGPIIAAVPGVLAATTLGSTRLDWSTLAFTLLVIGIYVVVVQVQANLMAPFITGQAVRMSPATILIGLIVGFQVGGLIGSLLVVPVMASIKEAGTYVLAKLLDRDPFAEDEDRAGDEPAAGAPVRTP